MRRTAALALVTLTLLSACGGGGGKKKAADNGGNGGGNATSSATVDTTALGTVLSDWALNTAKPKYPDISPPIWSGGADQFVLAFLPAGADPVGFCQEIDDVLTETVGTGFDGVTIHVVQNMSELTPLAVSDAGAPCA